MTVCKIHHKNSAAEEHTLHPLHGKPFEVIYILFQGCFTRLMTTSVACVLKRFTENRLFRRYFAVNVFGLDVIHEHDQQILQTPLAWRKRPDGFSHYNDMQYMRMMDYRLIKCIPMDEFMRGANASFRCVVNSIFSHPKLLPHRITSPEEIRKQIKIEDEDIREEALAFPDIFETFLSRFLEQSVMRFLHDCPNHKFAYELMQIRSVKIYAAEQFLFSVELAKKHPYLIFDQSMKEQFQEVKILTAPTKLPGDEDCHNIQEVFRVWVDVECDGKYIANFL